MGLFNNVKALNFAASDGMYTKVSSGLNAGIADFASMGYTNSALLGGGAGAVYGGATSDEGFINGAISGGIKGAALGAAATFGGRVYSHGAGFNIDNGVYRAGTQKFNFGNFTKGWGDAGAVPPSTYSSTP